MYAFAKKNYEEWKYIFVEEKENFVLK